VAAVKPDWLTQQAGADSQPNLLHKPHSPDNNYTINHARGIPVCPIRFDHGKMI